MGKKTDTNVQKNKEASLLEKARTAIAELVRIEDRFLYLQKVAEQIAKEQADLRNRAQYLGGVVDTVKDVVDEATIAQIAAEIQQQYQQEKQQQTEGSSDVPQVSKLMPVETEPAE